MSWQEVLDWPVSISLFEVGEVSSEHTCLLSVCRARTLLNISWQDFNNSSWFFIVSSSSLHQISGTWGLLDDQCVNHQDFFFDWSISLQAWASALTLYKLALLWREQIMTIQSQLVSSCLKTSEKPEAQRTDSSQARPDDIPPNLKPTMKLPTPRLTFSSFGSFQSLLFTNSGFSGAIYFSTCLAHLCISRCLFFKCLPPRPCPTSARHLPPDVCRPKFAAWRLPPDIYLTLPDVCSTLAWRLPALPNLQELETPDFHTFKLQRRHNVDIWGVFA